MVLPYLGHVQGEGNVDVAEGLVHGQGEGDVDFAEEVVAPC